MLGGGVDAATLVAALGAGPPPPECRWGRRPHRGATACRLLERDDRGVDGPGVEGDSRLGWESIAFVLATYPAVFLFPDRCFVLLQKEISSLPRGSSPLDTQTCTLPVCWPFTPPCFCIFTGVLFYSKRRYRLSTERLFAVGLCLRHSFFHWEQMRRRQSEREATVNSRHAAKRCAS